MEVKMKEKINSDIQKNMDERFGHDTLISVATIENGIPHVRIVDSYYEDGTFYTLTHAHSNKMKNINANPTVALCSEWFTAHGIGENIGHPCDDKNAEIAKKLRVIFSDCYCNDKNKDSNPDTCILCIRLTDGILIHDGIKYEIDFSTN